MENVLGAIFPISAKHAERIFDEGRVVYVKYTTLKLDRNYKILFYVSKENNRLIGEGIIERIEKAKPEIAWSRFGKQLFLNEDEFNEYISKSPTIGKPRKMQEITVFLLKNIKKYSQLRKLTHNLTPAGCYLSKEEYRQIISQ